MAYEFKLPDAGEGIAEGEVMAWHVEVGQFVKAHDPLLDVETDKALVEVPSPVSGVLVEQRASVGDVVEVGAVIAVLNTEAGTEAKLETARAQGPSIPDDIPLPGGRKGARKAQPPSIPEESPAVIGSVGVVGQLEEAPDEEDEAGPEEVALPGAPPIGERVKILPRDRVLARSLGVNPNTLRGTGKGGRVTEEDVRRASSLVQPASAPANIPTTPGEDGHGPVERVKIIGVRRKIAGAMVRSLATAAQVTTTDEADVTRLALIREREQEVARAEGVSLTYLPFIIKAVAAALKRDPHMNASLDDEAGELVVKGYYNIGVATETRDGLLVPVVKGADRLSIVELAAELERLTARARKRELEPGELKGSTFTLSNFGSIGGIFATPILNPGETGLLGIGRVDEKPVAREGSLAVAKVMPLSLTFDHRVVDGATAQHFLSNVVARLEDPDLILIGA